MTTEQLKQFVADKDFGYAETTGAFCAVCDNETKDKIADILTYCNAPEMVQGEELNYLLSHHPEFGREIANGCQIYACEEYNGANRVNTHYIAYYD